MKPPVPHAFKSPSGGFRGLLPVRVIGGCFSLRVFQGAAFSSPEQLPRLTDGFREIEPVSASHLALVAFAARLDP